MIREARADEMPVVRQLFTEYENFLDFDLCFQSFEEELAQLPGRYAPPGGCLLLATENEDVLGCIALRQLEPGICEMKRLYVRPEGRSKGLGRALCLALIERAKEYGHNKMRLDTVGKLQKAIQLYRDLGFVECPRYCDNPQPDVQFFELQLIV